MHSTPPVVRVAALAFGLIATLPAWPISLAAAESATSPSLRDVLTAEEFARAGLHKLTEEELAFLSRRILAPESTESDAPAPAAPAPALAAAPVARTPAPDARPAEGPPSPASAVAPPPPAPEAGESGEAAFGHEERIRADVERTRGIPKAITSRIEGEFRGWSGRTIFRLANGQVWQQVDDGVFAVKLQDPTVTIERGALNSYFLRVEGYGSRVKVRRVR